MIWFTTIRLKSIKLISKNISTKVHKWEKISLFYLTEKKLFWLDEVDIAQFLYHSADLNFVFN